MRLCLCWKLVDGKKNGFELRICRSEGKKVKQIPCVLGWGDGEGTCRHLDATAGFASS